MSDPIITVENLGKRYSLRHEAKAPYQTLREALAGKARQLFSTGKPDSHSQTREDFWALRDVSFSIERGDVVGIIGRNGAGKSTLLKILSRITEPTTGRIRLGGRVASLLEVGTGFHPELSGRENIFLNGAVLGMTKAEIRTHFDEIVAFAEVERFLDTPVKHYSSGMYMRLAFAVAAHLNPEILIVDEVLAVGDSRFQNKCLTRMRSVAHEGRTVLFVSHNMGAVQSLCKKGLLLNQGSLLASGPVQDVIAQYQNHAANVGDGLSRKNIRNAPLYITGLRAVLDDTTSDCILHLILRLSSVAPHKPAFVAFDIIAPTGVVIMQALPTQIGFIECDTTDHLIDIDINLPPLVPGTYRVTAWAGTHYTHTLDHADEIASFEITKSPTPGRSFPHTPDHGFIVPTSALISSGLDPKPCS